MATLLFVTESGARMYNSYVLFIIFMANFMAIMANFEMITPGYYVALWTL